MSWKKILGIASSATILVLLFVFWYAGGDIFRKSVEQDKIDIQNEISDFEKKSGLIVAGNDEDVKNIIDENGAVLGDEDSADQQTEASGSGIGNNQGLRPLSAAEILAVLNHDLTYQDIAEHSVRRWNLNSNAVNSRKIVDHSIESDDLSDNIDLKGDLLVGGDLEVDGTLIAPNISGDTINYDTLNATTLDLGANTITDQNFTGDWNFNAGDLTNIAALAVTGNLNLTASTNLIFGGTTSLGEATSATDSGAYLVGANDEFANSASTNVQGVLKDLDIAIASGGPGAMWTLTNGNIYPTNLSNNVGIGTANPLANFHVNGHCIAGDSILRRRRRRRKKNGEENDNDEEYDYDFVPVIDIKEGDEIESFDEKTNTLVWKTVSTLLDMGVQEIVKIETKTGKSIRTTSEHPYFTRKGWKEVKHLYTGDEIAVVDEKERTVEWDTIISLVNMPEEQVWDLEIADTHTFIANDIVAHNTYISGGLGVGTTNPSNGTLAVLQPTTNAVIIGDTSGDARGSYALDVQNGRNSSSQVASGIYSSALGNRNTASGDYSSASGRYNTASGRFSSAFGYANTASGVLSSAFGIWNTASGYHSSASGYWNDALGINSSASGYHNTASGSGSSAFGSNVINNIANSVMIGPSDAAKMTILSTGNVGIGTTNPGAALDIVGALAIHQPTTNAVIIGDTSGNARGSYALDVQSGRTPSSSPSWVASGDYSAAFGFFNTASGDYSSAFGLRNTASGYMSSASGSWNTASGIKSSAFGFFNTASGYKSSASGYYSTASGYKSSASGYWNTASGINSSASGYHNTAPGSGSSAFGSNVINNIANSVMIGPSNSAKMTILSTGNVGIGTTNPGAALDVYGDLAVLQPTTNAVIIGDTSGNARGSYALDVQSARSAVTQVASGDYSAAFGSYNTVSGSDSSAFGYENTASGVISSAVGSFNTASGNYLSAFGYSNTASGEYSSAFGSWNDALGEYSSAFGYGNTASGLYSSAFGSFNTASGYDSSAFGDNIINNIANSLMIGPSDAAKMTILSTGNVGIGTTAPGAALDVYGTLAVRQPTTNAVIIGDTSGNARGSYALDVQSRRSAVTQVASGDYSSAFGYYNTASGYGSSASGYWNNASGGGSSAFGSGNTASGGGSSAFGSWNIASGVRSSASGFYNTASGSDSSAFGSNVSNNIANSVMIGPSDAAKMTILSTGNVGIGTTAPASNTLQVTGSAGKTVGGTAWDNLSDIRFKNVTGDVKGTALEKISQLRPIKYEWNSLHEKIYGESTDTQMYGFAAQELKDVIPEFVTKRPDGYYWYNPSGIEAILTAGIQEQQILITKNMERTTQLDLNITNVTQSTEELQTAVNDKLVIVSNSLAALDTRATANETDVQSLKTRLQIANNKLQADEKNLADFQTGTNSTLQTILETESILTEKIMNHEDRIKSLEDQMATITVAGGEIPTNILAKNDEGNVKMAGIFTAKGIVAGSVDTKELKMGEETSGSAKIKAGETEVEIKTEKIEADSKVYVTLTGSNFGKTIYVDEAKTKKNQSFAVTFDGNPAEKDITFNWLIIN